MGYLHRRDGGSRTGDGGKVGERKFGTLQRTNEKD